MVLGGKVVGCADLGQRIGRKVLSQSRQQVVYRGQRAAQDSLDLDPSAGADQTYGEDCPVCCNPNVIHVEFDPAWEIPRVWAEAE